MSQALITFEGVILRNDYSEVITKEGIRSGKFKVRVISHNHSRSIMQQYVREHPEWETVNVRVGLDVSLEDARYVSLLFQ